MASVGLIALLTMKISKFKTKTKKSTLPALLSAHPTTFFV